jgi:hypothetical protein
MAHRTPEEIAALITAVAETGTPQGITKEYIASLLQDMHDSGQLLVTVNGSSMAVSGLLDGANLSGSNAIINQGIVYFGPPRGGTLDDGAALQALVNAESAGARRRIMFRPGNYYFSTSVDLPSGITEITYPGAGWTVTQVFTAGGGDPTYAHLRYLNFPGAGGSTTLTAQPTKGASQILVDDLVSGTIVAGALINIRPAGASGQVFRVTGAPVASGADWIVYLDAPIRGTYVITTPVHVVTGETATPIIHGNQTTFTGTGSRVFSLSRCDGGIVEDCLVSNVSGVPSQFLSWDNLSRNCTAERIRGITPTAFLYQPIMCEGGDWNQINDCSFFGVTVMGIGLHGFACTAARNTITMGTTGAGFRVEAGQGTDSIECRFLQCTSVGGQSGFVVMGAGNSDATLQNISPTVEKCVVIGALDFGVNLDTTTGGGAVIIAPRIKGLEVRPRTNSYNFTCYNDTAASSTTLFDAQSQGITCKYPAVVLGGGGETNVALAIECGGKFADCVFENVGCYLGITMAAGSVLDLNNVNFTNATSSGTNTRFAHLAGSGAYRLLVRNSKWQNVTGTGYGFQGTNASAIVEAENSSFINYGGNRLVWIGCVFRSRNCISIGHADEPTLGAAAADRNIMRLTLNGAGTAQSVPFSDARSGDTVTVSHITDAGTPAAIVRKILIPGTGATVYGAAGDTSVVQVAIGA